VPADAAVAFRFVVGGATTFDEDFPLLPEEAFVFEAASACRVARHSMAASAVRDLTFSKS